MKKTLLLFLFVVSVVLTTSGQLRYKVISEYITDNTSLVQYKIDESLKLAKTGKGYYFKIETPMQFTSYAIGWHTESEEVSTYDFTIFFKAHKPGFGWTRMKEEEGYLNPENTKNNIYQTDLLFGIDELLHDSISFAIYPPKGVELSEVHLILMDISQTVDLKRSHNYLEFDDKSKSCLEIPPIIPRSEWCGGYADCHNPPNTPGPINPTHIIMHYGYAPYTYTDSYAVVRSYWNYHVNSNGWWDIGYNYLTDKYGNLFQGRHNVNIPYVNVRGVHAGAPNDYSVGICYIGNSDVTLPTTEQNEICLNFLAWWFDNFNIDPLSYASLPTNWSGNPWQSFPRIIGHKDVASTSCPGTVLYDLLPSFITQVSQKIDDCGGLSVTTQNITSITQTTAVGGGNVTDDGGFPVTARGVVWSKSEEPTTDNNQGITFNGSGTGSFTSNLTGLSPSTLYYVRAYATNSQGTSYGQQRSFATLSSPCPGIETVNYGGRNYGTIQIGDQCWMAENLKYDNGCTGVTWVNNSDEGWCGCYNNDCATHSPDDFGYLYQLSAAQNICPNGWKLASDNDWKILEMELGMNQADADLNDAWRDSGNVGSQLASWTSGGTNSSGFSAEQAGIRIEDGSFHGIAANKGAFWWSEDGIRRHLWHANVGVNRQTNHPSRALSVRCIYDGVINEKPSVQTVAISDITTISAKSGGNVTSDGGKSVIARGVVWGQVPNPSIQNNDGYTSNGTGIGVFTSNITGLSPNTSYYVRAYATNEIGTAYGQELSFTTEQEQDYNVYVDFSNHYEILSNSLVTVNISISGLPEDLNPLGLQGSVLFDTDILEYQGYIGYQLEGSALVVSEVSGHPNTRTIFWSTDHGSSMVTNGDLLGLQFIYKGEGEICTDIVWKSDPLLEMLIDDEWNQIEAIWNDGEICGIEEGFVISGKIKYAGSVNASGNQPVYNEPIYNLDSVIVIIETLQGLEVGRDTTDNSGEFYIDNIFDEGDYKIIYYKLNNDYYKWIYSGTGVNIADVGMFRTYVLNPFNEKFNFDDLYLNAMDFNDDGSFNTIDISMLQTKIVNPFNSDYINMSNFMPKGTWMGGVSDITINSDIGDLEYVLIAYGDYNASATAYMYNDFSTDDWITGKSNKIDEIIIETDDILVVEGNSFTLPVFLTEDFQNNFGFQIELEYPDCLYKLLSANVNIDNSIIGGNINKEFTEIINSHQEFLITDFDGVIRMLYTSPHEVSFDINSDEVLINLEFEKKCSEQRVENFYLKGKTSLIANSDFELTSSVNLKIPKLKDGTSLIKDSELFSFQVYPNPARELIFLEIDVYKSGVADISLIDLLGRELIKLESNSLIRGINKFEFNVSEYTSGIYNLRINYRNSLDYETVYFKLIID